MIQIDPQTGEPVNAFRVVSTEAKKDISTPCSNYLVHKDRLQLVNTLMGGTKAMIDAGQTYLPKEPAESETNYTYRLNRTYLFNAFRRTVSYLSGQVFAKSIVLQDDVPVEIKGTPKEGQIPSKDGFVENIDLKGNNIDVFCKDVFEDGVVNGVTTILVDSPPAVVNGIPTKADERKAGLRPYWVHVPTTSIIGWKTEVNQKGEEVFTQLRIKEYIEVDDPENAYNTITKQRIRLLEAYPGTNANATWEVYQYDDIKKEWLPTGDKGTFSLPVIPLAVFMPGEKISALTAVPPLEDLAYLNLAHWKSTSDQENILHFTRLPILFGKKINDQPTKIEIGPNRMIHADSVEADLRYVEHTGASIGAGHANLVDLETKMAMWGLQLLMPKTGNITATEKALSSGESDSTLKSWAIQFKDFLEQCLYFTAQYLGNDNGGTVYVNTEYRWMQTLDAEVLLRAWQFKLLPRRTIFDELQRRGIIGDDVDFVEVMAEFEEEQRQQQNQLIDIAGAANKYFSVNTEPTRSMSGVGSPFAIKRGSGKDGGV